MGWTSNHATHCRKNGEIDRRAECEEILTLSRYQILKSAMKGSVFYAAARNRDTGITKAFVILTRSDRRTGDWLDFRTKVMDEDMGPCETDCPPAVLDLLPPPETEFAAAWRAACRRSWERKHGPCAPSSLPLGTRIEIDTKNGTMEFEKVPPAFQFRRPFWFCEKNRSCIRAADIPEDFRILSLGGAS